LEQFVAGIAYPAALNSLAQVVLKITSPGMPDIYRGTEIWDFSLVDPDNRRRVDFELRQRLLQELESRLGNDLVAFCDDLVRTYRDGRIKLWTTLRALRFRREHAQLFQNGSYAPLAGSVEKQEHLVAFARFTERDLAIVAVPRLSHTLARTSATSNGSPWGKAELVLPPQAAAARLVNVFTGEELRAGSSRALLCADLFAHFPVALLELT
jgi:(1->4)-alpha-D-glucan 1-alpha-D-glucosylmutase